jgi:hypothetical protein
MARRAAIVVVVGGMLLCWLCLLGQGGLARRSFLSAAALAAGPFAFLGGALGWEFFLSDVKARAMVERFGRTGARFFYATLGAALIAFGVWTLQSGWYRGDLR